MRMAIMGVGSLGTLLGAYLSKGGVKIDLIEVNKEHVDAINTKGITISGWGVNFTTPAKALTPDQMEGVYDLVFYLTKQTYNETAFKQLKPHLNENSVIVTGQNGLPELAIAKEFGEKRVLGMPILWGGTWKGPGFCELTSDPTKFDSELGSISGEITPMMHEIKKVLEPNFGSVHFVTNLMGIRLTKQLINSAFSGMSTVIAGSYGEVSRNPKAFKCARFVANEVIKVAKAAGIKMEAAPGLDLKLAEFHTFEELDANAQMYTAWIARFDGILASMLQDLQKGRKCEILAINGVISDMGDQYAVDTPVNDQVVKIVSEIEAGKRTLGIHNLDSMVIPDKV